MYLVDTTIWIDFLRNRINHQGVDHFREIIDQQIPFGITSIIYQEILQGAASIKDFEILTEYLGSQRFFQVKSYIESYQSAAKLYMDCKKRGITIRSTIDCLIAQVAMEHDLILLHNDKDYHAIKKVTPQLKLYEDLFR